MFGSVQGKRRTMWPRLPPLRPAVGAGRVPNCCDANQLSELDRSYRDRGLRRYSDRREWGRTHPVGRTCRSLPAGFTNVP